MKATKNNNINLNDNLRLVPYKVIVKSKKELVEFKKLQKSCNELNCKLALVQGDNKLSKKVKDSRINKLMCEYLKLLLNSNESRINDFEIRIDEMESLIKLQSSNK